MYVFKMRDTASKFSPLSLTVPAKKRRRWRTQQNMIHGKGKRIVRHYRHLLRHACYVSRMLSYLRPPAILILLDLNQRWKAGPQENRRLWRRPRARRLLLNQKQHHLQSDHPRPNLRCPIIGSFLGYDVYKMHSRISIRGCVGPSVGWISEKLDLRVEFE